MSDGDHALVLLVEDDDDIRDAVADALDRRGYSTRAVEDGHAALAYLRAARDKPRVILLDLTMPRMSGWEFMQHQARDPEIQDIPVILLSAVGNIERQAAGLTWAGVLRKPITLETLLETVGRFM